MTVNGHARFQKNVPKLATDLALSQLYMYSTCIHVCRGRLPPSRSNFQIYISIFKHVGLIDILTWSCFSVLLLGDDLARSKPSSRLAFPVELGGIRQGDVLLPLFSSSLTNVGSRDSNHGTIIPRICLITDQFLSRGCHGNSPCSWFT